MVFEQLIEHYNLFLVLLGPDFLLTDVVSECSTRKGEREDPGKHNEDGDDLLELCVRRQVAVTDRRNRRHRVVERGHV